MKVAVVILNYNGIGYIDKFLPKTIKYSKEAEIFFVDNKSTDESVSVIKERYNHIHLIELHKNYGYAGGYNQALKQIQAENYILLNSDIEVTQHWLKPLIHFMDQNDEYVACQPKIRDYHQRNMFEYAGAAGGFIDALGYPYCRGRIFDTVEEDKGQYEEATDIFWASGACFYIRAKDFHLAGGFDNRFFAHMEEIDLCWRLRSNKRKLRYIPQSVIFHEGGGTLNYQNPFKTFLNFRNGMNMLIKNLPWRQMIYILPLRIILDWAAAVVFFIQGKGRHSLAIGKAHIAIVVQLIGLKQLRNKTTSPLSSNRFILWDYYIGGKKKFSDFSRKKYG